MRDGGLGDRRRRQRGSRRSRWATPAESMTAQLRRSDAMNGTNRQAAWASDPRWTRAREHATRGEVLQAEMLLRSLLAEHRDCTPARLTVADFMVQRGDLD